jgi:hypothetical protein
MDAALKEIIKARSDPSRIFSPRGDAMRFSKNFALFAMHQGELAITHKSVRVIAVRAGTILSTGENSGLPPLGRAFGIIFSLAD